MRIGVRSISATFATHIDNSAAAAQAQSRIKILEKVSIVSTSLGLRIKYDITVARLGAP